MLGALFLEPIGPKKPGRSVARVQQQCKSTWCFEHPVVLGIWEVQRVAAVEDAIHSVLEACEYKRVAPGTEWFDPTIDEVQSIITFVQLGAVPLAVPQST